MEQPLIVLSEVTTFQWVAILGLTFASFATLFVPAIAARYVLSRQENK